MKEWIIIILFLYSVNSVKVQRKGWDENNRMEGMGIKESGNEWKGEIERNRRMEGIEGWKESKNGKNRRMEWNGKNRRMEIIEYK